MSSPVLVIVDGKVVGLATVESNNRTTITVDDPVVAEAISNGSVTARLRIGNEENDQVLDSIKDAVTGALAMNKVGSDNDTLLVQMITAMAGIKKTHSNNVPNLRRILELLKTGKIEG